MSFPSVDTPTSEAAAEQVNPVEAKVLRERVFQLIKCSGSNGLTDEEIQDTLNLPGNTQRPRRWELSHKEGRIRKSGTRLTKTGRQATVWVANAIPTPIIEETVETVEIKIWWAADDESKYGPFFTERDAEQCGMKEVLPDTTTAYLA